MASRRVRDYLKNFSETQWNRVIKATVMMGIQELERSQGAVNRLSVKDLEDLVVTNESVLQDSKCSKASQQSKDTSANILKISKDISSIQHTQESKPSARVDSSLKKAVFSNKTQQRRNSTSPAAALPNYNFKNTFKPCAEQRRRDLHSNIVFETHRSSSQPTEGPSTSRFKQVKANDNWRQPVSSNFMRNGQKPSNRLFNEELLQDSNNNKRSKSLNPLIYPEWWGDQLNTTIDDGFEQARQKQGSVKRKLYDDENSLDRRLMEVKEGAMKIDRMMKENTRVNNHLPPQPNHEPRKQDLNQTKNSKEDSLSPPPTQTYYHIQHEQQKLSRKMQPEKENSIPNQQQMYVGVSTGGIIQQHSPPRYQKPPQKPQQMKNNKKVKETPSSQPQSTRNSRQPAGVYQYCEQTKQQKQVPVPQYLKKVESKIKDNVLRDKFRQTGQDKVCEIYVKEKQPQVHQRDLPQQTQQIPLRRNYVQEQPHYQESQQYYSQAPHFGRPHQDPQILQHPYGSTINVNVGTIAQDFLNSPLMTQFSSEQEGGSPIPSDDGKPKTITLQMSNYKQQFTHQQQHKQSMNTTNFVNQTLTSQGEVVQHRNQFSTYYNHNPVSIVQQEGESGFYSQGDFMGNTLNYQQQKQHRGAPSVGGMTQILQNMNINEDQYQGMQPAMYRSDQYREEEYQQTYGQYRPQHQATYKMEYVQEEQPHQKASSIQPYRKPLDQPLYHQTQTDESTQKSPKIDHYHQVVANQQSINNPFQTRKDQQFYYNPQMQHTSSTTTFEQRHRQTASQPFNYQPQQNNYDYQQQTPLSHYRHEEPLQSPMSEDPNAYSQKFYQDGPYPMQNHPSQQHRLHQQLSESQDISSDSLSNYTQTEDLKGMLQRSQNDGNTSYKMNESSMLEHQRLISQNSVPVIYKQTQSQTYLNPQMLQQPSSSNLGHNESITSPSTGGNNVSTHCLPKHDSSIISLSQNGVSPVQNRNSIQKLKTQNMIDSSDDSSDNTSMSSQASYFSNELSHELSESDQSIYNPYPKPTVVYTGQSQDLHLVLKQQQIQFQQQQQHMMNQIPSDRKFTEITTNKTLPNGQFEETYGQVGLPATFSFQKHTDKDRQMLTSQGTMKNAYERFTFQEEVPTNQGKLVQ